MQTFIFYNIIFYYIFDNLYFYNVTQFEKKFNLIFSSNNYEIDKWIKSILLQNIFKDKVKLLNVIV